MLRRALAGTACLLALAPAAAAEAAPERALLVFVPGPAHAGEPPAPDPLLRDLAARPGLAVGLMSPTQGRYSPQQALLDMTQGTRVPPVTYDPQTPPALRVVAAGNGGRVEGWASAARRANTAPGSLVPGRLAAGVPGGVGYIAPGPPRVDAVVAADRRGRIRTVARAPAGAMAARTRALLADHRLVVVDAPRGAAGDRALDALLGDRRSGELVIVVQAPPPAQAVPFLPIAVVGNGAAQTLTSETTRTPGVVAGIDLLPTLYDHLGLRVNASVTGQPIRSGDARSAAQLEELRVRYGHPAPRRIRTLALLLAAWGVGGLALTLVKRGDGLRRALRLGALSGLWLPSAVLVPAAIDPASAVEEAILTVGLSLLAALITDRALPWPRGPLAPAASCLLLFTGDLAAGTDLLDRSMLGPNPRAGARFFGIGNELEAALPILLFAGVAAAYAGRPRSRGMALAFGGLGALVAAVVGSGHLGADVGGVITISAGAAVAVLLSLPGGVTRRGVLVAATIPVIAVALLAVLDLVSGASSHFARNVLEARSGGSLGEVVARRYELAWQTLGRGRMPWVTAGAVLTVASALLLRDRLYGRMPGPAWRAAMVGGLAAGTVGALANDSGPILFVVATFVLGIVTPYLLGAPGSQAGHGSPVSDARRRPAMQEWAPAADGPEGDRPPAPVP